MGDPFVLGVNYQPRRQALYWWQDFDAGEVREDFALIRELGLTKVRVFLLWDDFQPTPERVSPQRFGVAPMRRLFPRQARQRDENDRGGSAQSNFL